MRRVGGQILRLSGLFIEMLGVLGVITGSPNAGDARMRLPWGATVSPAWMLIAGGFVIWLVGTVLAFGYRPTRS
jgi:hypothetical protein